MYFHSFLVKFAKMVSIRMLVVGMITFGALNTLVRKAQMVTCSTSSFPVNPNVANECPHPDQEPFNKPWIGNIFMFMGEILLLASIRRSRSPQLDLIGQTRPELPSYYLLLPASLDVLGSGVSGVGMLFITASVWQMMRGSLILFTAALSVIFLGRKLERQHIVGLSLSALGLGLVGLSSWLDSNEVPSLYSFMFSTTSSSDALLGITLTVLSQLCTAIQVVVEESLLKMTNDSYRPPSPERIVAFEGLWGCVIMIGVLIGFQLTPGPDHGSAENSVDSIEKLFNSSLLIFLVGVYLVSIAAFNVLGMKVSKHLSSVHRTLIDSSRSVVVWIVQLGFWYIGNSALYGTPWTDNSWLQLIGFAILVLGTLVYNEVISVYRTSQPEDVQSELVRIIDSET